jgi:signal transduction histidine kinase
MSFANRPRLPRSVASRLTLAYAALFTVSFLIVHMLVYFMTRENIARGLDEELFEELHEVGAILDGRTLGEARPDLLREADFDGIEKTFIRVFDAEAREVLASNLSYWENHIPLIEGPEPGQTEVRLDSYTFPRAPMGVRVITGPVGGGLLGQVALSADDGNRLLADMREVIVASMAIVAAFATLVGWLMGHRVLRGLAHVTRATIRISEGDLDSRVPVSARGDEIDQLAETFNVMADRVQSVLTSMREITDNIAHDLRSPIARLRGRAELALSRPEGADGPGDSLAVDTIEECDRLLAMINTMLDISELEAGVAPIERQEVSLGELIADTCDLFEPVAVENGISLTTDIRDELTVMADLPGLQRALANLVDNSLKYTASGGRVEITLGNSEGAPEIRVRDTGIGIKPEELPHIFDRFYRGDRSRSRMGSGLGLSLARALMRAQGGDIAVSNADGPGVEFTISLAGPAIRAPLPMAGAT